MTVYVFTKAEGVGPVTNSVHRVTVLVEDCQELELTGPIISVAADRGGASDRFDLWYEHCDGREAATAWVCVLGTGHPAPWTATTRKSWRFVGTVVTPSGLVWHVYTGPVLRGAQK